MKDKLGFEWHRVDNHNKAKFTPQLQSWINNFIERKRRNRERANPLTEVYIDESYVNEHHSTNFSWFLPAQSHLVGAPSGRGRRIVMMDAGCANGFIDNVARYWYGRW